MKTWVQEKEAQYCKGNISIFCIYFGSFVKVIVCAGAGPALGHQNPIKVPIEVKRDNSQHEQNASSRDSSQN